MDITISGYSDDLIHIFAIDEDGQTISGEEGLTGGDEFGVWDGCDSVVANGSFTLIQPDGTGCKIHVIYDGCWSASIGQLEEGSPIPSNWSFGIGNEHAYSTRSTISNVHPDAVLTHINKD